ncbi:hypothetical protein K504DRAFT_502660 [Pleomassaria siparia CBS 279.74]|uniref:Uncharacterized protein n=1 Tax=Pleomassaria siparia CBS 279.74 TaxID=1314801 RepID=A0A6G1K6X2_9PLEO|nr:hypothetical protein K504DRAFT_502660 [Pleomassaria siparia CBS 279.74]
MGIGVTIGVFGLIFITAIGLLVYQKLGPHRPEWRYYEQGKGWDQFDPMESRTLNVPAGKVSANGGQFLGELPVGPAAVFSPDLWHMSWNSRASWLDCSPDSPTSLYAPVASPIQMPV